MSQRSDYETHRANAAARVRAMSLAGRDIGELPAVAHPERRTAAERDFKTFCEVYFPRIFSLPWSRDHLRVIARIETVVLRGGLFAIAMPRGSGKTSLCEIASLWATLYGHREFVALIGATERHASEMLDSIKAEIERNELLAEDFPEVCMPVRALEGINKRCAGQLYRGKRTAIIWSNDEIVLPTIEGSRASGAIVRVAGITGRIRGMKYRRPDGRMVRPSLVILDDPQTDESARSVSQCITRERIISGAVLGLSGPDREIAAIMPCTVIRPGDLAATFLDRDRHPEWCGEKCKMVYAFPTSDALWSRYAEIRAESLRKHGDIREATEFYRAHRAEMDEGADVAWPERYERDEISGIQHAMNLRLRDERVFWAECQNEPQAEAVSADATTIAPADLDRAINAIQRGIVPVEATHLTAAIDVQAKVLYWTLTGWADNYTGAIVDYGVWPEQGERRFTEIRRTLQDQFPSVGLEGQIYRGLHALFDLLLSREYPRADGVRLRISRLGVDASWGVVTDTVYAACRQHAQASILLPMHGKYVGASATPMSRYTRKPGDTIGNNWLLVGSRQRAIRYVLYDTNYWKTFVATRLLAAGDRGGLTICGTSPTEHREFFEHLLAEYATRVQGRDRLVDEWRLRPGARDNHWWDALVMATVLASIDGCQVAGAAPEPPRRVLTSADLTARRKLVVRR